MDLNDIVTTYIVYNNQKSTGPEQELAWMRNVLSHAPIYIDKDTPPHIIDWDDLRCGAECFEPALNGDLALDDAFDDTPQDEQEHYETVKDIEFPVVRLLLYGGSYSKRIHKDNVLAQVMVPDGPGSIYFSSERDGASIVFDRDGKRYCIDMLVLREKPSW
jgi:hypothetical protein